MTPEVEQAYRFLGDYISRSIGEPWTVAWIGAEIESDREGYTWGRYIRAAGPGQAVSSFLTDGTVHQAFATLRTGLNQGEEPWTQAVFTLRSNGRFTVDFRYGPLQGTRLERILYVQNQRETERL
jgi:hypothetical protein